MAAPKKLRGKIGVIGLGIIGTRVAANLRSAGHQVYVWSRTPRAAPNFLGSVVEVADLCDVIQIFVSDDGALHEVTRTIAAALRPRHVVLCHATVSPGATRQAAGIVQSQGARYLDAPFTGSKAAAQNRQLVYYIGGAKPALEEVRPVLEATSKAILYVGGIGDASVVKIATNMLTASTVQTLAEALALVRAAGIDASKLVEALENNASRSGTSDLKLPAMIAANAEPNFSLKHMLKDVRFAQELADRYELSLPLTDTAAEVFTLGMQNGWADQDFSVVSQLYPVPVKEAPKPEPATAKSAPAPAMPAPAPTVPIPEGTTAKSVPATPPPPTPESAAKLFPPPATPKPEAVVEDSASEPPAPKPEASAPKPESASATVTTPAAPAAAVPEKSVPAEVKHLAPVAGEEVAALLLPPQPASLPQSATPDAPVSTGNGLADAIAKTSVTKLAPADNQDEPASGNKKDGAVSAEPAEADKIKDDPVLAKPAKADKKGELSASKQTDASAPAEPAKKPEVRPANGTAPNAAEAAKREKKSTFKLLRNFFKSVPTKPR